MAARALLALLYLAASATASHYAGGVKSHMADTDNHPLSTKGHLVKHASPVKGASAVKGGTYYPFDKQPVGNGQVSAMSVGGNGIDYHDGPLIIGNVLVYLIWYGDWSDPAAKHILTNLVSNIGGSPYWAINQGYYSQTPSKVPVTAAGNSTADKNYVTKDVFLAGEASDPDYSRGKTLSDDDIQAIVEAQLTSGALPVTPMGIYMVMTAADVELPSGFCDPAPKGYCGWHSSASILGLDIRFAFVGNADACPIRCAFTTGKTTNDNWQVDAMASILAHELEEAVTDPDLNAWFDETTSRENADKCAWRYGDTYGTPNGGIANMRLGEMDYLIQQNWVNDKGGYCASSWTGAAASA